MNSRQRRKLAAIQHNDAIRYDKWLVENTAGQTRNAKAKVYIDGRKKKLPASIIINAVKALIGVHYE